MYSPAREEEAWYSDTTVRCGVSFNKENPEASGASAPMHCITVG
jgi:hypothetical protein